MNIVYDNIIYWLQNDGGASRYWYEIVSRSLLKGSVIGEISRRESTCNPWAKSTRASLNLNNFMPLQLDRYLDCTIQRSWRLPKLVFHSSHYRVPFDRSVPNVVTVHDFTYEMHIDGIPKLVHCWQKLRAMQRADVIICISNFTKRQLILYYPELTNKVIKVIHHGVSPLFHRYESPLVFSKNVIFLGARTDYKRFDLSIAAVARTNDLVLQIIGPPLTALETSILNSKIPGRWIFSGRLTDFQLNLSFNNAFCFIYPSESEGFGLPLLEAMRAGCPVICSNRSVFPEIAGTFAVFPEDQSPEAYVSKLNLLRKTDFRIALTDSAFKHSSSFTWDRCFDETYNAYELAREIKLEKL